MQRRATERPLGGVFIEKLLYCDAEKLANAEGLDCGNVDFAEFDFGEVGLGNAEIRGEGSLGYIALFSESVEKAAGIGMERGVGHGGAFRVAARGDGAIS